MVWNGKHADGKGNRHITCVVTYKIKMLLTLHCVVKNEDSKT